MAGSVVTTNYYKRRVRSVLVDDGGRTSPIQRHCGELLLLKLVSKLLESGAETFEFGEESIPQTEVGTGIHQDQG